TKDGAWFENCHYPYAITETGPGHASVASGCSPRKHGIVSNDWFDRIEGDYVYCAASERHERVPPAPKPEKGSTRKQPGGTPERLKSETLGDALKAATGGKGKVVALSLKDRSTVLPAGRRRDACCYWFDAADGMFVTSTYYRERVHPWVEKFNKERVADRW